MCVSVAVTPATLFSRSATTAATSSWLRTRTIAIRSIWPVTEYTSLTPSSAAISSATSGIRATSALTNTIAVIMAVTLADRLVLGAERPPVLEGHQRLPRLLHRVVHAQVLGGAADRAGPLALDVHQAPPVGLEPAQDLLGLLGRGGRCRAGTRQHRLGGG